MNIFDISLLKPNAHIHFIGIGGVSMSGLAQVLLKKGFRITGSDQINSPIVDKLSKLGANISIGHQQKQVLNADLVVYTAAVHDDNPELMIARKNNIPCISRAKCLGGIMKEYKNAIGVSGTHGKTTTTSMLAHAFLYAKKDPTISIGGNLDLIDGNIRVGNDDLFVTEACEYTNSFLEFFPSIALITNIEADHLDFFNNLDEIIESFRKFALLTRNNGFVVALGSDENIQKALKDTNCYIRFYGLSSDYDYYADNIVYKNGYPSFDIFVKGKFATHICMNVAGEHNILNALATIAVCDGLQINLDDASKGIESFLGTHRRFERKGIYNGATIIDDYAHHPTEIQATIKAAKSFQYNRLWCIFQPHTYTRTRSLWNDFLISFDGVDELIITDIYAAREKNDGVTNAKDLAQAISERGVKTRFIPDFFDIEQVLKSELAENDMVFTMGAGNVVEIGENLLK